MPNATVPAAAIGLPSALRPAAVTRNSLTEAVKLRSRMERAVMRLIDALDALDAPLADIERDPDEEPSTASPESETWQSQERWAQGSRRDGEAEMTAHEGCIGDEYSQERWSRNHNMPDDSEESDADEDDGGAEPVLGAPELRPHQSQENWCRGGGWLGANEEETTGCETGDAENQTLWARGARADNDAESSEQALHLRGGNAILEDARL